MNTYVINIIGYIYIYRYANIALRMQLTKRIFNFSINDAISKKFNVLRRRDNYEIIDEINGLNI